MSNNSGSMGTATISFPDDTDDEIRQRLDHGDNLSAVVRVMVESYREEYGIDHAIEVARAGDDATPEESHA